MAVKSVIMQMLLHRIDSATHNRAQWTVKAIGKTGGEIAVCLVALVYSLRRSTSLRLPCLEARTVLQRTVRQWNKCATNRLAQLTVKANGHLGDRAVRVVARMVSVSERSVSLHQISTVALNAALWMVLSIPSHATRRKTVRWIVLVVGANGADL